MLSSLLAKLEPSMESIRVFYAAREPRERRALLALAGVLVCVLFYALLLAPLYGHLMHLRADIKRNEATLAWMQSADRVLSSSDAVHSKSLTPIETLAALQAAIQASSLSSALRSLKQNGDQSISLQWEAVPFDQLIIFLSGFEAKNALAIRELTVDHAGTTPGMVNVSMVFAYPSHQK